MFDFTALPRELQMKILSYYPCYFGHDIVDLTYMDPNGDLVTHVVCVECDYKENSDI